MRTKRAVGSVVALAAIAIAGTVGDAEASTQLSYSNVVISNVQTGKCLERLSDGSVWVAACDGSSAQRWNLVRDNGVNEIQSVTSGLCLYDYYSYSYSLGGYWAYAQLKSCNGGPHELWTANLASIPAWTFQSDRGCLDAGQDQRWIYTNGTCNPNNGWQQWEIGS